MFFFSLVNVVEKDDKIQIKYFFNNQDNNKIKFGGKKLINFIVFIFEKLLNLYYFKFDNMILKFLDLFGNVFLKLFILLK